ARRDPSRATSCASPRRRGRPRPPARSARQGRPLRRGAPRGRGARPRGNPLLPSWSGRAAGGDVVDGRLSLELGRLFERLGQAELRLDLVLDLERDVGILLEEPARVLLALAQLVALVRVP